MCHLLTRGSIPAVGRLPLDDDAAAFLQVAVAAHLDPYIDGERPSEKDREAFATVGLEPMTIRAPFVALAISIR